VDTAACHGGDEFALVLPLTSASAARLVGQRIRELLATDAAGPALSVSVGVAGYASDATTIGTLLYAADRALYEMKETSTGTPCEIHEAFIGHVGYLRARRQSET